MDRTTTLQRISGMRTSKIVISVAGVLLLLIGGLIVNFIMVHASTSTSSPSKSTHANQPIAATYPQLRQLSVKSGTQKLPLRLAIAPQSNAALPTQKPTGAHTSTATATQVATTPAQTGSGSSSSDRYYPIGTPVNTMI